MATVGTFSSFTQARLAIYASQAGLSVTGNNIANINTEGYTRQKLDQTSFRTGGADRYHSSYSIRIGSGVLTTGVSQLRDPYLDIRYRSEMSDVGAMDAKLGGLENIQAIIDEVGDGEDDFGVLESQISDLYDTLQKLSTDTGQMEYDIQVRSAAQSLTNQLKSYASSLQEVYNNTETAFKQDVDSVNTILSNIRDLNAAIRKNEVHGDSALELKDERNQLIDQLAEYMNIDVTYEKESVGAGITVDKLVIKLANANPDLTVTTDSATLVDGTYATQLEMPDDYVITNKNYDPEETDDTKDSYYRYLKADRSGYTNDLEEATIGNDNYTIVLGKLTNAKGVELDPDAEPIILDDNDLYGALQSERELLTEAGEFSSDFTIQYIDENAATKRGIPYYQKALDLLANQIANAFNDANQNCIYNENGEYLKITENEDGTYTADGTFTFEYTDEEGNAQSVTLTRTTDYDSLPDEVKAQMVDEEGNAYSSIKEYVAASGGKMLGTPLFSNHGDSNDTTGITAGNISISDSWADGPQVVSSFMLPTGMNSIPTTDSSNISHMLSLFTTKMDYTPSDVSNGSDNSMFHGTFQEFWTNINSVLGNDMKVTNTMLDMHYASSVNLETSRSGVSGVDLNDEAMNLMQYSQSYNAACRLMTTIDSVLDKLINGTAV